MRWRWRTLWIALLLMACNPGPAALPDALPETGEIPGWKRAGEVQRYGEENLFDLVNGQADAFFAYAFEQVIVGSYEKADGALRVELWQLATPADAYGLYTTFRAGEPAEIGAAGDIDRGRRLDFWQDRYLARLFAPRPLPPADLQIFGEAIAAALPGGGTRPALVDRLPPEGLVPRSAIFFHREISIQNVLWLGGQNLLELSSKTDGVLARYDLDGSPWHLLLIEYPDAEAATDGVQALRAGRPGNLMAARSHDTLLGAVFGSGDQTTANDLLDAALAE
jgi:hypothetical protein